MKRLIHYLIIYAVPFLLLLLISFLIQQMTKTISSVNLRIGFSAVIGLIFTIIITQVIDKSLSRLKLQKILWGNFQSIIFGTAIGILISSCSGFFYGLYNGYQLDFKMLFSNIHLNIAAGFFPALSEEIIFRGGIVNLTTQIFGLAAGLTSGSVPFGILHIAGELFGQHVTVAQIIGITLAGLMLSLMYLNSGIFGAFACHLVWNTLVGGWAKAYGAVDRPATISALEGSWITCLVLTLVCLFLYFRKFGAEKKA